MQKLDFTEHVKEICNILRSNEILVFIDALPQGKVFMNPITSYIIESKSNYDKITPDDPKMKILTALQADKIYSQENISNLINQCLNVTIQNQQKVNLFLSPIFLDFYFLHHTIMKTTVLCDKVLFQEKISELQKDDTVVFRIVSDDGLAILRYSKILTLLNELIDVIQKVGPTAESTTTITLLDSGSDTNVGIKTTTDTAKSLFQIFKEVWDWVLNRKFYKNKLRNDGMLDSLNVMIAIKEAQNQGAIDDDTAKIYRETIIRRTEDLLELHVIPKDLIEIKNQESSKKLLGEFTEIKQLESGQ